MVAGCQNFNRATRAIIETTEAPAPFSIRSISRRPPRTFLPFTSSGTRTGLASREAEPPACHSHVTRTQPFSAITVFIFLPISAVFQA